MQYCGIISLDHNNSVKFTSSRGDNSTANDSMVMKIACAQLHMYTIIMYKFQSSMCNTVGEKLQTKLCLQIDGRKDERMNRLMNRPTDSHGDSSIPPSNSLWGYNNLNCLQDFRSIQVWVPLNPFPNDKF